MSYQLCRGSIIDIAISLISLGIVQSQQRPLFIDAEAWDCMLHFFDAQPIEKPFVTNVGLQSHAINVETITPPPITLSEVSYALSMQDEDITPLFS